MGSCSQMAVLISFGGLLLDRFFLSDFLIDIIEYSEESLRPQITFPDLTPCGQHRHKPQRIQIVVILRKVSFLNDPI